jgi:hypothetical protein
MGILQRTTKLVAAAAIKFTAHCLCDELAAVLFKPVDVPHEVVREGHSYAFYSGHFIL